MSTRTAVLAHAGSPGAGMLTQIGAVPLTDTWIIKDVRISTSGTAAGNTQIYVTDVTGNDFGYLFNKNMAANELDTVSGFVVVPPGGQLWVHWQTNSQFVWVSGADLPGHI